ncbi:MAG: hypothetical protein KC503_13520 [Myxococcales bacterium]|nr:hypothetical protein [Myxococcales bacterium]
MRRRLVSALVLILAAVVLLGGFDAEARRRRRRRRRRHQRRTPVTAASASHGRGPRVVQVTDKSVFISAGARDGLAVDDRVTVKLGEERVELRVASVAPNSARLDRAEDKVVPRLNSRVELPEQARARASKRAGASAAGMSSKPRTLPAPESERALAALWQGVSLEPRRRLLRFGGTPAVRRAGESRARRMRGTLRIEYLGNIDLSGTSDGAISSFHQLGLYSDLEVPKVFVNWLDYAHRVRLRLNFASDLDQRRFQDSRPNVLVYRLRLGINTARFRAQLGRVASAPLVGAALVDGGSARVQITRGLSIGAYGGLSPRAADLRPSTRSARFGGYASLRLSPGQGRYALSADAGFIGTTFGGDIDRQAISARASFDSRAVSVFGSAVVDLLGSDHESGVSGPVLTWASVHAAVRPTRSLSIGARVDRYRFPLTRELIADFGRDFSVQEAVLSGRASVDLDLTPSIRIGGGAGYQRQSVASNTGWGDASLDILSLLGDADRLRLSALASIGSSLTSYGGRLSYSAPVTDWLDLAAAYGAYADTDPGADALTRFRQSISASVDLRVGRHISSAIDATALLSPDERVMLIFASVAYHL